MFSASLLSSFGTSRMMRLNPTFWVNILGLNVVKMSHMYV